MSDKTKWIFETDPEATGGGQPREFTETLRQAPPDPTQQFGTAAYDPTRLVERSDDKTQLYLGTDGPFSAEIDPVVGWLVVIKGPGIGAAVTIGAGMNVIGRGTEARVSLPFGDMLISGDDHLRIIYDDANRTFLLAPGTGKNITRLNGQVVTSTTELANRSVIELSKKTAVRFVAFCDETFDWGDMVPSREG